VKYHSTKTYGNERGLSCCFRQWRADSHCNLLHGYSLGFRFIFGADELDESNWVYDFGSCSWIKEYLERMFDHKLVVAKDDPELEKIKELHKAEIAYINVMDDVGCEKFAETVYNCVAPVVDEKTKSRVFLISVEVFEHNSNSAIYNGDNK
jgi:6-pyruvoyltetrahydropterin/6-carboxytetrahydropterin synthase